MIQKYLIGLMMLLVSLIGANAITFDGVTVNSSVSNTSVYFDTAITMDSMNITNDSIIMNNYIVDGCVYSQTIYTWTGINTLWQTSTLAAALSCEVEQVDSALAQIIALAIGMFLVMGFILPVFTKEHSQYVTWVWVAGIVLAGFTLVLALL